MTSTDDNAPRRLTFVVHALTAGGAQRVIAAMANHWVGCGWPVTVVTLSSEQDDVFHLDSNVRRAALDLMGESESLWSALQTNRRRVRGLRSALQESRPDVVVSFLDRTNVLSILAAQPLGIPVIATERSDPRHHPMGAVWSWLRRRTYPRAAAVVVQTESVRSVVRQFCGSVPVHVIANGVRPPSSPESPPDAADSMNSIVALGRLDHEKGFDLLLDAWARIEGAHPSWKLNIYGDGPERATLEQFVENRIPGRVEFAGWVDDPQRAYANADLFALPSRYEGFPNALLEAMACGLPAVSFECESGPAEIIRHGDDGLLVRPGDVAAFAQALDRLIREPDLRKQYGGRAREVLDRFGMDRFYSAWETVFEAVAA